MRKSTALAAPLFVITSYFVFCLVGFQLIEFWLPGIKAYLPVGGIDELLQRGQTSFEQMEIITSVFLEQPRVPWFGRDRRPSQVPHSDGRGAAEEQGQEQHDPRRISRVRPPQQVNTRSFHVLTHNQKCVST